MYASIGPISKVFLQKSTFIYTACIFLLACLTLFYATLVVLQATHFFENHLFDLSRISAVLQTTAIATQTCTVSILVALPYVMSVVASDTIVTQSMSAL